MNQLKGKFIFVVEDNTINRTVFHISLVMSRARVEFERWGGDTIRRLQNHRVPDLIILDLMLHNGVSGYDIFAQIRELPRYDDTPIVAVSAADPSIAIPKAKELGFSGFISKPIDEFLFPDQLALVMCGATIWNDGNYSLRG